MKSRRDTSPHATVGGVVIPPGTDPARAVEMLTRSYNDLALVVRRILKAQKDGYDSLPRQHAETHLVAGGDPLATPAPPLKVAVGGVPSAGSGPSYMREDAHLVVDRGSVQNLGVANVDGASGVASDGAHVHKIAAYIMQGGVLYAIRRGIDFDTTLGLSDDPAGDRVVVRVAAGPAGPAGPTGRDGALVWSQYRKTYADLAAAALTNDVEILSLPARNIIHAVLVKHRQPFSGGAIASYTVSVGVAGDLVRYAPAFDVFQAYSDTAFEVYVNTKMENFGAATSIRLKATSTVGNLNAATQGLVDVYFLTSDPGAQPGVPWANFWIAGLTPYPQ